MVVTTGPKVLDGVTIGGDVVRVLKDECFCCGNVARKRRLVCVRFFFSTYYASTGGLACLSSVLLRHPELLWLTTSRGYSSPTMVVGHRWVLFGL
jgi:hypothetical protein